MRRLVQERTIADSDQPKSIFGLEAESASVNDVRMISGTNSAFICLIKSYGVKLDKKPEKKTSLVFNSH